MILWGVLYWHFLRNYETFNVFKQMFEWWRLSTDKWVNLCISFNRPVFRFTCNDINTAIGLYRISYLNPDWFCPHALIKITLNQSDSHIVATGFSNTIAKQKTSELNCLIRANLFVVAFDLWYSDIFKISSLEIAHFIYIIKHGYLSTSFTALFFFAMPTKRIKPYCIMYIEFISGK